MLSLLQLQYFQAVAQEGNLTQAAQKLFISQTTLSTMLTKLEGELGVQLFDRRKNRLWLNAYGKSFLVHVNAALGELEQGQQELAHMRAHESKVLTVCSTSDYVWEELILRFSQAYPDIHISHYHDQISAAGEELRGGQFDFVITGEGDIQSEEVEYSVVTGTPLCLCMRPDNPLAGREGVSLAELDGVSMVNLTANVPFQRFVDRLFQQVGAAPVSVIECGYTMRPKYTAQGLGVAITNDVKVCRDIFPGHVFVSITDENSRRNIALYWRRGRSFTTAMELFAGFLRATMADGYAGLE